MKVRFIKDDTRFNIKKGDEFEALRHRFEPDCKVELTRRISDNFNPECMAYNHQVEKWSEVKKDWVKISCTCCV